MVQYTPVSHFLGGFEVEHGPLHKVMYIYIRYIRYRVQYVRYVMYVCTSVLLRGNPEGDWLVQNSRQMLCHPNSD